MADIQYPMADIPLVMVVDGIDYRVNADPQAPLCSAGRAAIALAGYRRPWLNLDALRTESGHQLDPTLRLRVFGFAPGTRIVVVPYPHTPGLCPWCNGSVSVVQSVGPAPPATLMVPQIDLAAALARAEKAERELADARALGPMCPADCPESAAALRAAARRIAR